MASPRDRKNCREASRSGHTFPGDVGDPPSISTARREWPANKVRLAARQRPMSQSGGVARCREPCGYERGGLFRELIDDAPVARTGYLSWFRQDGWFGEAAREVVGWPHGVIGPWAADDPDERGSPAKRNLQASLASQHPEQHDGKTARSLTSSSAFPTSTGRGGDAEPFHGPGNDKE